MESEIAYEGDGDIDELDLYVEAMYGDEQKLTESKRRLESTRKMLLLCLMPENMEVMLQHGKGYR